MRSAQPVYQSLPPVLLRSIYAIYTMTLTLANCRHHVRFVLGTSQTMRHQIIKKSSYRYSLGYVLPLKLSANYLAITNFC